MFVWSVFIGITVGRFGSGPGRDHAGTGNSSRTNLSRTLLGGDQTVCRPAKGDVPPLIADRCLGQRDRRPNRQTVETFWWRPRSCWWTNQPVYPSGLRWRSQRPLTDHKHLMWQQTIRIIPSRHRLGIGHGLLISLPPLCVAVNQSICVAVRSFKVSFTHTHTRTYIFLMASTLLNPYQAANWAW